MLLGHNKDSNESKIYRKYRKNSPYSEILAIDIC